MQRLCSGLGIAAARTDGDQVVLGLDHIAVAGDDVGTGTIRDAQQGLEPAQAAVAAPILGKFDGRPREIAEFLEFPLETLEQRESIRRPAGESRQHLAAVQAPHLAGVAFHDALSERHLAVAADGNPSVTPHRENRGSVNPLWIVIHVNPIMWGRPAAFQALR